jgi:hypothetical protein
MRLKQFDGTKGAALGSFIEEWRYFVGLTPSVSAVTARGRQAAVRLFFGLR